MPASKQTGLAVAIGGGSVIEMPSPVISCQINDNSSQGLTNVILMVASKVNIDA